MNFEFTPPTHPFPRIGKKIETLTRKAIYNFNLIENSSPILVALSGGKDSITLLSMLCCITSRGFPGFKIHAVYVEGDFSCGAGISTNYIKKICNYLNVELTILKSAIKTNNLECYNCSRERRKLIFDLANKLNIDLVAFGHHLDDNIQTLLMNLFQKGEFKSMLPKLKMYKYNVTIIRPLIYIEEEDIIKFANHFNFKRQRCNCPNSKTSKREKTKQIIEEIKKQFPNIKSNLSISSFLYGSKKAAKK